MSKNLFLLYVGLLFNISLFAQTIPIHQSSEGIYEFIDEMASLKLVDLNSAIKPYSRQFIADQLQNLNEFQSLLNKRQKNRLDFYLKEFEEAQNTFEKCLALFPEDKATMVYIKRCIHYLKVGWDDDWDGVTKLYEK